MLIVLLSFGSPSGGLIEIPISFFLKNKLHLEAHEVATFRLIAACPIYLSFLFGFIRDIWNPFGMRDRGYMLLFGVLTAAIYVVFAFIPFSYTSMLAAVILVTASYLFVASAQHGLTSVIGQQNVMSGQISAVWNVAASIPVIGALLLGGILSNWLEQRSDDEAVRILFLIGGAFMAAVAIYAIWRPRYVFDNIRPKRPEGANVLGDLRRLLRHWPIYPALLIWLLWNFAPGSATPLQYHLQNNLHATDAQWGQWNAIFAASFIPTFLLFGYLSRKLPLRTLLVWGTVVARATTRASAVSELGSGSPDCGRAGRPDGRRRYRRLPGSYHPLLSAGSPGYDHDDVGHAAIDFDPVWRRARHTSL
jgi:drug/metabolite transporter (DMT)-like permease